MKQSVKSVVVLFAICAVAAVILAFMNNLTSPVIEAYEASVEYNALQDVSCSYEIGIKTEVSDNSTVNAYYELTEDGKLKGYLLSLSGAGYGGPLVVVASYDTNGVILQAKLSTNSETPGVGKKAENSGYMDKFIGKGSSDNPVPTSKDMLSDADSASVSGASLTFNGVSKALNAGSEFVKNLGGR